VVTSDGVCAATDDDVWTTTGGDASEIPDDKSVETDTTGSQSRPARPARSRDRAARERFTWFRERTFQDTCGGTE
jgi:hypothetical protein